MYTERISTIISLKVTQKINVEQEGYIKWILISLVSYSMAIAQEHQAITLS